MRRPGSGERTGRRVRLSIAIAIAGLAAGCSPAPVVPSQAPPATAPPRAQAPAWPDVVWVSSDLDDPPAGTTSERAVAVAGSRLGFVAVGVAEATGRARGSLWFSPEGSVWRRAGAALDLEGVSMVDVTATDDAFVAVGTIYGDRDRGIPTRTVTLRSDDGERWERLPEDPAAPESYSGTVAASATGFLSTSFTLDADGLVVRTSDDGRSWRDIPADALGDAAGGIGTPVWTGEGWIATGVRTGSPVVLRSADGGAWTATALEPPADGGGIATDAFAGAWGALAIGITGRGCEATSPCDHRRVAWWSSDGVSWLRAAETDRAIEQGLVVAAGDRGVISVSGLDAWSCPDGRRWRSLGQPSLDGTQVNDAVVRGNLVVAVGDTYRDDSTSFPTFLTAGPPLVLTE